MLVRSDRVPEISTPSPSFTPFTQMVARRLTIARMGLAEARQHLDAGQDEDAGIVLEKIDEDLHLLRRRLIREAESISHRSSARYDCVSQSN